MTFWGEKKAQAQSAPIANPRAVHTPRHLPTMDFQEYAYLKAAAEASASVSASTRPRSGLGSGSAVVQNFDFNGNDRFGSADQGFIFTPPDVNTAMGLGRVTELSECVSRLNPGRQISVVLKKDQCVAFQAADYFSYAERMRQLAHEDNQGSHPRGSRLALYRKRTQAFP